MFRVALIGAGQLGSRHLQALAKSKIDISIEVVEPFEQSRAIAKQRYDEVKPNYNKGSVIFLDSIDQLSPKIDIVIIATSSDFRFEITKDLLNKKEVKYLILEKVLFQSVCQYHEIEDLLRNTNTSCWVNHPRRMWPFYQQLKKELSASKKIVYSVQGGEWGLGCNGLHFIDHLSYMADSLELIVKSELLDDKIYSSKRSGFIEFNGELTGSIGNSVFYLHSYKDFKPTFIIVSADNLSAFINESSGYVRISRRETGWKWEVLQLKIVHQQSELTDVLIGDLTTNGKCDLPTYYESMRLHIPFIESLLAKIEYIEKKKPTVCPIT